MEDNKSKRLDFKDEWYGEAKNNVNTIDELNTFYKKLFVDYVEKNGPHDYNTMCYATAAFATAAAAICRKCFGITALQMSCVACDIARNTTLVDDSCGCELILRQYSNMLYPQYDYKFDNVIKPKTWELLQDEAKKRLERDGKFMTNNVREHMQGIVDGKVPFGYTVSE